MISIDTNIIFHAFHKRSSCHKKAIDFLRENAENSNFVVCELILIEFYCLIRNPVIIEKPLTAENAVKTCQAYRCNTHWQIIDYPGGLMGELWQNASVKNYPRRKIFDDRLALTLKYYGVKEFATKNIKDFKNSGFKRVWDPLA